MRIRGWAAGCVILVANMACDRAAVNDARDMTTSEVSPADTSLIVDMPVSARDMDSQEPDAARPLPSAGDMSADMRQPKDPPDRGSHARPRDPNAVEGLSATCCDGAPDRRLHVLTDDASLSAALNEPVLQASAPSVVMKSSLELGEVVAVEGSCDVAAITTSVKRRVRGIQKCHERALESRPELAGQVKTSVIFSAQGRATTVNTESNSSPSDELAACVNDTLKRIRYVKQQDGECHFTAEVTFSVVSK